MSAAIESSSERAVWIGYGAAPFGHAVADPEDGCARALHDKAELVLVSLALPPDRFAAVLRRLVDVPVERRSHIVGVGKELPPAGREHLELVVESQAAAGNARAMLAQRPWVPGATAIESLVGSSALTGRGSELTPVLRALELALGAESAVAWATANLVSSGPVIDAAGMAALERASSLGTALVAGSRTFAGGGDRRDGVLLGVSWARPRFVARAVVRLLDDLARRVGRELALSRALATSSADLARARANRLVDPRTGVLTSDALVLIGSSVAWPMRRLGRPLCVAVVDVVGLRHVNVRYGHATGDAVLAQLAETVSRTLRKQDTLGAFEDDAVAVVLPDLALDEAERSLARIFGLVARAPAHDGTFDVPYQVQIGLTAVAADERIDVALRRAATLANRGGRVSTTGAAEVSVPREAHGELEPGDLVADRFQVLHRIGGGALSDVYRGVDTSVNRPVAIRILKHEVSEAHADLDRCFESARRTAAVRDRALCDVITSGSFASRPYVVMELVDGASLAERAHDEALRNARVSAAEVVSTLEPIAAALDLLHARGIAHTDVRAGTIIRDPFEGRSVLLAPGPRLPEDDDHATAHDLARAIRGDLDDLTSAAFSVLGSAHAWIGPGTYADLGGDDATSAVFDRAFGSPDHRYASAREMVAALRSALQVDSTVDAAAHRTPSVGATRGLVFRAFGWTLGPGRALPAALVPELRDLLSSDAPALAWFPRQLFDELVRQIDSVEGAAALPRRAAHALVRTSFRRFFPASALTLTPVRVLRSLPFIWQRYHSWGRIETVEIATGAAQVRLVEATCTSVALGEWLAGLVEQLVALSGGVACSSTVELDTGADLRLAIRWSSDTHDDLRALIGDLFTRGAP